MLWIYTKERHRKKLGDVLGVDGIEFYSIFTAKDAVPANTPANLEILPRLAISYCYPRLIPKALLDIPYKGWVNFHPGPLPEFKGPGETTAAVEQAVMEWGVTCHIMDEGFDTGPVIQRLMFPLHEPPTDPAELSAVSHWMMFWLFQWMLPKLWKAERLTDLVGLPDISVHDRLLTMPVNQGGQSCVG